MSKTYNLTQPYIQNTLLQALAAAGVNVTGISGSLVPGSLIYYASGTVTTDDNAVDATVNAVIAANSLTLLQVAQQMNLATLYSQAVSKQAAAFDSFTQFNLLVEDYFAFRQLVLAKLALAPTQRMNYCASAFAWMGNIYSALQGARAAVNAAQDPATASAVTLGPTQTQNGTLVPNGAVTGNTHTSTTIDNIANTSALVPGMVVSGSGIVNFPPTTIVSVAANSITISQATTTTVTGATISYSAAITGLTTTQISTGMTVSGPGVSGSNPVVASPVTQTTMVAVMGGTFAANSGSYTFTLPAAPNVTIDGALSLPS